MDMQQLCGKSFVSTWCEYNPSTGLLIYNRYLEQSESGYYVHNLGTGNGVSVMEMIEAVEKVRILLWFTHVFALQIFCIINLPVFRIYQACGHSISYKIGPRREGDIAVCYADTAKALNDLGWKAQRSLDEACAGIVINYYIEILM